MANEKGTSFTFQSDSEIRLSQRGSKVSESGGYSAVDLVQTFSENINFSIGMSDEDENFHISLDAYHIENKKTGEAYHCNMQCNVSKKDLLNIKYYINALLSINFEDDSETPW